MDIITGQEADTLLPSLPQTGRERNNLSTRCTQGPRSLSLAVSMEQCFAPQQNVPISRTFTCHKPFPVLSSPFSVRRHAECILDRQLWVDRRAGRLPCLHNMVERPDRNSTTCFPARVTSSRRHIYLLIFPLARTPPPTPSTTKKPIDRLGSQLALTLSPLHRHVSSSLQRRSQS
jgi:hypothetical protein